MTGDKQSSTQDCSPDSVAAADVYEQLWVLASVRRCAPSADIDMDRERDGRVRWDTLSVDWRLSRPNTPQEGRALDVLSRHFKIESRYDDCVLGGGMWSSCLDLVIDVEALRRANPSRNSSEEYSATPLSVQSNCERAFLLLRWKSEGSSLYRRNIIKY